MCNQATAPYNFVSLPSQVLKSPIEGNAFSDQERQQNYREHILNNGKLNGYIELSVTTRTPVFIGIGNNESFFGPNGQPMIPGSSIRGMVKNIFKIVTCSAVRGDKSDADFNDKKLYFRSMAEKNKNIRKAYTDRMTDKDPETGKTSSTAKAGFLIHNKIDGQYYMVPTNFNPKKGDKNYIKYNSPSIKWNTPSRGEVTTFTGEMNTKDKEKCHFTIHETPDWTKRELVYEKAIQAYREDTTRKGVNIFEKPYHKKDNEAAIFVGDDDIDFVAPCFFVREHGDIEHFGFGRYYRIPYRLSIGDHVPNNVKTESVDYTDALFGRKDLWGSRIFFEDALGDSLSKEEATEKAAYPRILSGPKPTSYQLYLQQSTKDSIAHWDSKGVPIRGYKMYWHKKEDWRRKDKQEQDKQTTHKIQPVKAEQIFRSRIRFERLSKDELGALLKVFELSEKNSNLCFKLGQGKSIGMGSVRIEAKLKLTSDDYYRKLFTGELSWNSGDTAKEIAEYTAEFDKMLKAGLSVGAYNSYLVSQKELIHLLDWRNISSIPDWNKKTQMMSIEDADKPFQHRWKLPLANDVK